jgi:hypothetical protein
LGITKKDAKFLKASLLKAARSSQAIVTRRDEYGQRYIVDFRKMTKQGEGIIRSSWIVRTGEKAPRFLSCYIL